MKRFLGFVKRYWHKVVSGVCAGLIALMTVFQSSPFVFGAAPATWDDVGEDVIALRDAYFAMLSKAGDGNLIGASVKSATDIPLSWVKTVADYGAVISPVDDLYYYLKDGVLQYYDSGSVRSGGHTGGGFCRTCRKSSDQCTCTVSEGDVSSPVVPSSFLKDVWKSWGEYYLPVQHDVEGEYLYDWQSQEDKTVGKATIKPFCPVYNFDAGGYGHPGWGKKEGWNSLYLMTYGVDYDRFDTPLYGIYYYHFYVDKVDDVLKLFIDKYNLSTKEKVDSRSIDWTNGQNYLSIEFQSRYAYIRSYPSNIDYLGGTNFTTLLQDSQSPSSFFDGSLLGGKLTAQQSCSFESLLLTYSFTPDTNSADNWGYILSNEPFELYANSSAFDIDRVPDNYVITINGDTFYDYSITNPDNGDTVTIREYIDHDYDIPDLPDVPDPGDDSGGSVSGNVTVGGTVKVDGDITIKTDPIDINVNVNTSGSGSGSGGSDPGGGTVTTKEVVDLSGYLDSLPEQSETMSDYLSTFFSFLPPELLALLISGVACAILCRVLGR